MGRIFKTPSDDSTEATLRAMHTQNTLDTYYEKSLGWIRTVIIGFIAVLITSFYELQTGNSIWEGTVEWFYGKVENLANFSFGWLYG